jgi:hypothetical protein
MDPHQKNDLLPKRPGPSETPDGPPGKSRHNPFPERQTREIPLSDPPGEVIGDPQGGVIGDPAVD